MRAFADRRRSRQRGAPRKVALIVEINEAGYVWLRSLCLHIDPQTPGGPGVLFFVFVP